MNFYITLNENAILEDEIEKVKNVFKNGNYNCSILGNYESRGYLTLVIEVINLLSEDEVKSVVNMVKNTCDILEIDQYMKFYYILDGTYSSKNINDIVRKKLNYKGYKYKIYNSHSKEGMTYVGLKILNMNPFDSNELNKLTDLVEEDKRVLKLIQY